MEGLGRCPRVGPAALAARRSRHYGSLGFDASKLKVELASGKATPGWAPVESRIEKWCVPRLILGPRQIARAGSALAVVD